MPYLVFPSPRFHSTLSQHSGIPPAIQKRVATIIDAVRNEGDRALVRLTKRFDGIDLKASAFRIPVTNLRNATVDPPLKAAARETLKAVQAFAQRSLPRNWKMKNIHKAWVLERFDPLRRVGIYVPGGSVPLVSTVFMTVAIARVAGVREIVVCSPPPIAPSILWALCQCGTTEVYSLGGAQAIAAMALGTRTVKRVDKIFGPGNAYVTEAKRQLCGAVGIDLLAGPSEVMILADESAPPAWVATDLLAQAEHGSGRERVYCVSPSGKVLNHVKKEIERILPSKPNRENLRKVTLSNLWLIKVAHIKQMAEVANLAAPEHLQIMTRQPHPLAREITTAGAIFIGNYTPTVLGDFVAGPSHTLPTGGAGRSFSGLRTIDFMRRTSLVEYSSSSLQKALQTTQTFAQAERLPFHEQSVILRAKPRKSVKR